MVFLQRKRRKGIFRTHRFTARFRRNSEATASSGNRVTLFPHGGDFFPALFEAFQGASSTICAEYYSIKNDNTGNAFAEALVDAAARGVSVALIYDYIGCLDTPSGYFKRLQACGVNCLPFNKPAFKRLHWLDLRDHRKVSIIDGKSAYVGSLNVGDRYAGYGESPKRWRDFGVRLEGHAASALQELFRRTWEAEAEVLSLGWLKWEAPREPLGDAEVLIVNGTPHHNRPLIRSSFRMAMAGASESIRIITPYFVPGPHVMRSLLRAAARGVEVQLLLPAISDVPLVSTASKAYLAPLLKAGVEIYERQGTFLHAKVMLIDDVWVTLGSANLDYRSFHRNHELNVIVDSPEFGAQVKEMFAGELAKSRLLTFSEHQKRSWYQRLLERMCDPISRFL